MPYVVYPKSCSASGFFCTNNERVDFRHVRFHTPIVKLNRLRIRPFSSTVNLSKVVINCIFHRVHYLVVDPFRKISEPLIPGKLTCSRQMDTI